MYNIEEIILSNKMPLGIKKYTIILTVFLIIIAILLFCYKYSDAKIMYGYLDEEYNLIINLEEKYISEINDFYLNDRKTNYEILNVSLDYILDSNYTRYKKLTLKVNVSKKEKIVNNVFKIKIKLSNKTLFTRLKERKEKEWN